MMKELKKLPKTKKSCNLIGQEHSLVCNLKLCDKKYTDKKIL